MSVRRASSIVDYDLFELPKKTVKNLKNHFSSVSEAIRYGREVFFFIKNDYKSSCDYDDEILDFVAKLKKHHFLRKDIDEKSFRLNRLYSEVYNRETWDNRFPTWISELTNEEYESWQNPTVEEINDILQIMKENLSDYRYQVIIRMFGFVDEELWDFCGCEEIDKWNSDEYKKAVKEAGAGLRRLWYLGVLPRRYIDDPMNKEVDELINEIRTLHNDAIFKKRRILINKLVNHVWTPYTSSRTALDFFCDGSLDNSPIIKLGLSWDTFDCLYMIGLRLISDIANYPKECWKTLNIHNRDQVYKELEQKMHENGYVTFKIFS